MCDGDDVIEKRFKFVSRICQQRQVVIKIDNWDCRTGQIRTDRIILKKVSKEKTVKRNTKSIDNEEEETAIPSKVLKERAKEVCKTKQRVDNITNRSPELTKNRINLKAILQYSNATPIRCRGDIGYACCFCENQYPEPADLKRHTIEAHDYNTMCMLMKEKRVYSVKLDITGLQCQICYEDVHNVEQLVDHLVDSHNKSLFKNIKSYIMPMKFETDSLQCFICFSTFNKFKGLIEHMNTHSRNFVCEVCDAGFLNRAILRHHSQGHLIGSYSCDHCVKTFNTYRKKKSHERSVHIQRYMLNKCGLCNERFNGHYKKIVHLSEVHGVGPTVLNCQACEKTFKNQSALRVHIQRFHLMTRPHSCPECDLSFYQKIELDKHMVKHTGRKEFQCDICLKTYGRKSSLREHMRIHEDDRRFKCELCGMRFVQRCSWRSHMRSKHGIKM